MTPTETLLTLCLLASSLYIVRVTIVNVKLDKELREARLSKEESIAGEAERAETTGDSQRGEREHLDSEE